MLRKFAYNKIFRTTGMFILLLLLLLFPVSKEYNLEDTKQTIKNISKVEKREAYLLNKDGYIARCLVSVYGETNEELAENLIELMIIAGKYSENIPNGFRAILPSELKINALNIDKDSIIIDLSSEFYELKADSETKAIEMLTYNLTSIDNISKVYINIDGKKLEVLPNSKRVISQPLTRNNGINKNINITNYKDSVKTTIYYVSKANNDYYYVPVTKINNDKQDKIKIIVDELASSHIYETNLMSFLNYNTKLLNYDIKDNVMTLNFNNYLFDDIKTSTILEEVIYSISLSVLDNYDVKKVIFNVEGKEITKSMIKNIE